MLLAFSFFFRLFLLQFLLTFFVLNLSVERVTLDVIFVGYSKGPTQALVFFLLPFGLDVRIGG